MLTLVTILGTLVALLATGAVPAVVMLARRVSVLEQQVKTIRPAALAEFEAAIDSRVRELEAPRPPRKKRKMKQARVSKPGRPQKRKRSSVTSTRPATSKTEPVEARSSDAAFWTFVNSPRAELPALDRWDSAPSDTVVMDKDGSLWHIRCDGMRALVWHAGCMTAWPEYRSRSSGVSVLAPLRVVATAVPSVLSASELTKLAARCTTVKLGACRICCAPPGERCDAGLHS